MNRSSYGKTCRTGLLIIAFALSLFFVMRQAGAQESGSADEGLQLLNQAVQAKLAASNLTDLAKIIDLCEKAEKAGLSESSQSFCNQLLASVLLQRGTVMGEAIFAGSPPDPRWPQLRKLALADLDRALKLEPNQPAAWLMVARLNMLPEGDKDRVIKALGEVIDKSDDDSLMKAKALLLRAANRQDPEKRMADLDEAVKTTPGEANVLRARGAEFFGRGEYEKSLEDLKTAHKLAPEDLTTLELIANVLQKMDRPDDALKVLDQMQQLAPESLAVLIEKARFEAIQEKWQAALQTLDQAEKIAPANAAVYLLRSTILIETDQPDQALLAADEALKISPDLPAALRLKAGILAQQEKYQDAIDVLIKLRKALPEFNAELTLQLALLYSVTEQDDKALELFNEALEQEPNNLVALRGRADLYLGRGDQEKAIADYQRAIEVAPKDSGSLNNLAWLYCTSPNDKIRDGKQAIELAKRACEATDYQAAHILSTLAAAYAELGDFEKAREWSAKAVELGDEANQEALEKELESYKQDKPWREALPETAEEGTSIDSPEE